MRKIISNILFFGSLYLILVPQPAHAYLDPGTGSYVLQVAAAVFFAGLFLVKTWWSHIAHYFSKILNRKEKSSEKKSSKEK